MVALEPKCQIENPLLLEACVCQNAALWRGERTLDPTPDLLTPRLGPGSECLHFQPAVFGCLLHIVGHGVVV